MNEPDELVSKFMHSRHIQVFRYNNNSGGFNPHKSQGKKMYWDDNNSFDIRKVQKKLIYDFFHRSTKPYRKNSILKF
jgi:hypothetical protein